MLTGTDWAFLEMPTGTGEILPSALARLLDPNPEVRASAVGESLGAVTHQNTIYEATVPVALFVAAILTHPATTAGEAARVVGRVVGYPTRAALLDWLGSTAYDADDACVACGGRTPDSAFFGDAPGLRAFCELRPVFYRAVHPLLGDDHEEVRHAALIAAIPLTRHPLLTGHRGELADHARSLLASSTHRHRRDRALEALAEWGHDVSGLENADDVAVREHWARQRAERWAGGCTDDPPF
ncbi:hypothetical protein OH768_00025 [Streptomyces sp. NBC_01622]|uniref:hypothetical protein n=1 Tax=Streptomyces sp. NBC_01622 TaxID=2975903 RepID=UPI00386967B2|nr:hypothetical protein OH768_00025 [Streptomyces sp. NBC_01622]